MAATSGAMMRDPHHGHHLEGEVARRVDPQQLVRNPPRTEATDLRDRARIEDLGQLSRLLVAGELDEHLAGEAHVPVAVGGEPVDVVRPDDDDAATWPADPLHLRQAGLAAMTWGGRESRACDNQVGEVVGHRQLVEEAVGHPDAMPMVRSRELPTQELAQRRRGLDRNDLPRTVDELERQPTRARADLDDPLDVVAAATRARRGGAAPR